MGFKAKILLMEDDLTSSFFLKRYLENQNYKVEINQNHKTFNSHLKYDLYMVDISKREHISFIKNLKQKNPDAPVISLGSNDTGKAIECFNLGANIFHPKPVNLPLVESQIRNLIRKSTTQETINLGHIQINPEARTIKNEKDFIHLTRSEFNLLVMLIKNPGRVFSRQEILNKISNNDSSDLGAVDTLVSRIRKKVGTYKEQEIIETVYKAGFMLNHIFGS